MDATEPFITLSMADLKLPEATKLGDVFRLRGRLTVVKWTTRVGGDVDAIDLLLDAIEVDER